MVPSPHAFGCITIKLAADSGWLNNVMASCLSSDGVAESISTQLLSPNLSFMHLLSRSSTEVQWAKIAILLCASCSALNSTSSASNFSLNFNSFSNSGTDFGDILLCSVVSVPSSWGCAQTALKSDTTPLNWTARYPENRLAFGSARSSYDFVITIL